MAQAMAYEGPTPPTLAGYQVEELVGVGATGEVWRARDVLSGRLVALKRLRHDGPPVERDRLRREAAVLAGLSSPHLVRLVTVVTSAQGLILVLDYQAGGSLASLLRARPVLAAGEVVTVAAPLAMALAEVHALGMVHGDISPANVLFAADGRPVLADLGVARLVGRAAAPAITTAFADPAVLDGAPFTPASDVYALAAVCFAALTGAPPTTDDPGAQGRRLSEVTPSVPLTLATVLEAAMSADLTERPDAAAFSARLLAAVPAQPVRLAGASVPVASPPTAAVHRLPAPPAPVEPVPSKAERAAAVLSRLRMTPRRLVALAAVPLAVGGAIWGGVAWARSTSAGAPAWTAPAVRSVSPGQPGTAAPTGPLDHPGAPDPVGGPAVGAGAGSAVTPSGSPRSDTSVTSRSGPGKAAPSDPTAMPGAVGQAAPAGAATGPMATGRIAAGATSAASGTSARASGPVTSALAPASGWLAVLRALDRTRDMAFEKADPALLDEVYVAGSLPLAQDLQLLTAMRTAGDHAAGLSLVVRRVSVVSAGTSSAELRVTDTLSPYVLASPAGASVSVPGRGELTWRIDLVRHGSGWRISSIAAAGRADGSPAGRTTPKSGSAKGQP